MGGVPVALVTSFLASGAVVSSAVLVFALRLVSPVGSGALFASNFPSCCSSAAEVGEEFVNLLALARFGAPLFVAFFAYGRPFGCGVLFALVALRGAGEDWPLGREARLARKLR